MVLAPGFPFPFCCQRPATVNVPTVLDPLNALQFPENVIVLAENPPKYIPASAAVKFKILNTMVCGVPTQYMF